MPTLDFKVKSFAYAPHLSVPLRERVIDAKKSLPANAAILKRLAEIDQTLLEPNSGLRTIWTRLQPLLAPPSEPPRKRIKGFSPHED